MNILRLFAVLALTAVLCPLTSAQAATFTTNAVISETDFTYDGQDIVIDGAVTVAIDGPHAFDSLLLTNGSALTRFNFPLPRVRGQTCF